MPGPQPGAVCIVCNNPAIVLIDKAIKEGLSDRRIGGMFAINYGAIARHRKNHLRLAPGGKPLDGGSGEPAGPAPEWPGDESTPREKLQWLVDTLRAQAGEGDIRPDLARELRLAVELQGKMGDGGPPPVVRVQDVDGLAEMLLEMHEALRPHPEARVAMRAVWRRHTEIQGEGDGDADPA